MWDRLQSLSPFTVSYYGRVVKTSKNIFIFISVYSWFIYIHTAIFKTILGDRFNFEQSCPTISHICETVIIQYTRCRQITSPIIEHSQNRGWSKKLLLFPRSTGDKLKRCNCSPTPGQLKTLTEKELPPAAVLGIF